MGAGDVKLAGVVGLMAGYPGVLAALFLGILLGGAGALALLVTRHAGRRSNITYAPYVCLGALVASVGCVGEIAALCPRPAQRPAQLTQDAGRVDAGL